MRKVRYNRGMGATWGWKEREGEGWFQTWGTTLTYHANTPPLNITIALVELDTGKVIEVPYSGITFLHNPGTSG